MMVITNIITSIKFYIENLTKDPSGKINCKSKLSLRSFYGNFKIIMITSSKQRIFAYLILMNFIINTEVFMLIACFSLMMFSL